MKNPALIAVAWAIVFTHCFATILYAKDPEVARLRAQLRHPNSEVKEHALLQLGPLDGAEEAIPEIEAIARSKSRGSLKTSAIAIRTLGQIGERQLAPAAEALMRITTGNYNNRNRWGFVVHAFFMGIGGESSVRYLMAKFETSKDYYTRTTIIEMLDDVPSGYLEAVFPVLERGLSDTSKEIVRNTLITITALQAKHGAERLAPLAPKILQFLNTNEYLPKYGTRYQASDCPLYRACEAATPLVSHNGRLETILQKIIAHLESLHVDSDQIVPFTDILFQHRIGAQHLPAQVGARETIEKILKQRRMTHEQDVADKKIKPRLDGLHIPILLAQLKLLAPTECRHYLTQFVALPRGEYQFKELLFWNLFNFGGESMREDLDAVVGCGVNFYENSEPF